MKHLAGRERSDSCASAGELEGPQGRAGLPAAARDARPCVGARLRTRGRGGGACGMLQGGLEEREFMAFLIFGRILIMLN